MHLDAAFDLLAREPNAPLDLAEVALCLARDEYPQIDVEAHLNELNAMAHEARRYLRGDLSAQAHGLCRYLFHEMGFHGNVRDYYDPRNSYLNLVLERRTGIPISLSAIVLAVGRRAGLTLEGVGLPGHFIVKLADRHGEILLDPFHGGRVLTPGDCEILVQQTTGREFAACSLSLRGMPVGLIVQRMLGNLKSIYLGQQDFARALRILEHLRRLNPRDPGQQRDLGLCCLQTGRPGRAIDHLQQYLSQQPNANDVEGVKTLLRQAKQQVASCN